MGTGVLYDILYMTRRRARKKWIRRWVGLPSKRWKDSIGFLLSKGYVRAESYDGGVVTYTITREGYYLLYHMSIVDEKLREFFPQREGFDHLRRREVEKELTELLFRIPDQLAQPSYPYTYEKPKVPL